MNSKVGFGFAIYSGGRNGERFVELPREMMKHRDRPLHLVLDGLPAHGGHVVRRYVEELKRQLTLVFLPGEAPGIPTNWYGAMPRTG